MPLAALIPAIATIGSGIIGASSASKAANAQTQAAQTAANTQLSMYNQTRSDLSPYMTMGNSALSQLGAMFGLGSFGGAGGGAAPAGAGGAAGGGQGGMIGGLVNQVAQQAGGGAPAGGAGTFTQGSGVPDPNAMFSALSNFPGYQFGMQQGMQALDRSAASRGMLLSGAQTKAAQEFGSNYAMQQAWQPYVSQLNTLSSLGENAGAQVGNQGATAAAGAAQSQLAAGQSQAAGSVGVGNQLQGMIQNGLQAYSQYGGGASSNGATPGGYSAPGGGTSSFYTGTPYTGDVPY